MIHIAVVYQPGGEPVIVTGPFATEQEADEWVIQTMPGEPSWETIRMHERGETLVLECGHRIMSEILNHDVVKCPQCDSWQEVIVTT